MSALATTLKLAAAGGVGFGALAWASISPANGLWGAVHCRGRTDDPRYALSFDDGPTRDSTAAILDILGELAVPAAFFVIGQNVQRCPDLIARMDAEGHIIGNHTLDHAHLAMFRGRRYWDRQLAETDDLIERIIGKRPAMFRPPMGIKTGYVMGAAMRRGQAVMTWSRRAVDGIKTTSPRILDRLVPRTLAGDVLLLHDGVEPGSRRDPAPTIGAIKALVLGLRARGLEPCRLDALLGLPAYAAEATAKASA